jgi:hypothetical protein
LKIFKKSGSGYVGKEKKAQIASNNARQAAVNQGVQDYGLGFNFAGSLNEQEKALEGMRLGEVGYGQKLPEIGSDIQRVRDLQRQRTEGSDPVSEAIRNQKAGNMATIQRNMAASGVKGGAVAGALDEVARRQDADIASSMYGQQAQNIGAERSLASNMLAGTTSLIQGSRAEGAAANMPKAPETSGVLGTVICTELWHQGYYSTELYMHDIAYGVWVRKYKPNVYVGYRLWADPVVSLMKKSKLFSRMIATIAVPWARNMAGETNKLGAVVSLIGEPICGVLGLIVTKLGVLYARKAY